MSEDEHKEIGSKDDGRRDKADPPGRRRFDTEERRILAEFIRLLFEMDRAQKKRDERKSG